MRQLKNFSSKTSNEKSDAETVDEYMGKYKGMDEDQLINELMEAVKRSKDDGSYDEGQVELFLNLVSPQLNESQRTKLNNLIKVIKAE